MDIDFIDNFLKQSQTDNLKTKGLYPESVYDLDVKVSFGMGAKLTSHGFQLSVRVCLQVMDIIQFIFITKRKYFNSCSESAKLLNMKNRGQEK